MDQMKTSSFLRVSSRLIETKSISEIFMERSHKGRLCSRSNENGSVMHIHSVSASRLQAAGPWNGLMRSRVSAQPMRVHRPTAVATGQLREDQPNVTCGLIRLTTVHMITPTQGLRSAHTQPPTKSASSIRSRMRPPLQPVH